MVTIVCVRVTLKGCTTVFNSVGAFRMQFALERHCALFSRVLQMCVFPPRVDTVKFRAGCCICVCVVTMKSREIEVVPASFLCYAILQEQSACLRFERATSC